MRQHPQKFAWIRNGPFRYALWLLARRASPYTRTARASCASSCAGLRVPCAPSSAAPISPVRTEVTDSSVSLRPCVVSQAP